MTLQVGGQIFEPRGTTGEGTYYDLSELCSAKDDKALAFVDQSSFTIQLAVAIHGSTFVTQQNYLRYQKPLRWTTSAKINAKGLISFNLFFAHAKKLLNISTNPDAVYSLQARGLGDAYMELLRQLHARVSGKSLAEVEAQQQLTRFRGARGFVARHKIENSNTLYMDLLSHMYPAFADYGAQIASGNSKVRSSQHRIAFPDAFTPYLREPSWNRLIEKLFGRHLPKETFARLQPEKAPVTLLAGAFLVRSIVSASELLDFEIEPLWQGREGYRYLGEVRRILRAVEVKNRQLVLKKLHDAPTKRFYELASIIDDATSGTMDNTRKYKLEGFEQVRTWEQLRQQVAYLYHKQADFRLSVKQQDFEAVQQLVDDSFCSLPAPHAVTVKDGLMLAHSVHGEKIELMRVLFSQVAFGRLLTKPGALPRNSVLRSLVSEINREGWAYSSGEKHLRLSAGEDMLHRLVEALDRMLTRHSLERTARNRTRLLVALIMFGNSKLKEQNAVPPNAWQLLASNLNLPQVYSGFILNATLEQMNEFAKFPAHTRVALTGYDAGAAGSS